MGRSRTVFVRNNEDGLQIEAMSKMLCAPFIICLKAEVLCALFWDHARWLGSKQNTRNLYLQPDDKRCNDDMISFN